MGRRSSTIASLVSVVFALSLSTGIAEASNGPKSNEADTVASAVTRVAPSQPGTTRVPAVKSADGTFGANSGSTSISVPADLKGQVVLRSTASTSAKELRIGLPQAGVTEAATAATDGTITFSATGSNASVAVQGFHGGVRVLTVLKTRDSPSRFSYLVEASARARLALQDDGSVLVFGADGSLIGGFESPWAKDRNGVDVPTRYKVRGQTVVQVVDHRSSAIAYPVVADPFLFVDLIDHATWVNHAGFGWTLQVSPTSWGRLNSGGYAIGAFAWDELYTKYRSHGLCCNLNGMRDQLICHWMFAFWRNTYNLDEWRPDVGFAQTVNTSCNPGGTKWFD